MAKKKSPSRGAANKSAPQIIEGATYTNVDKSFSRVLEVFRSIGANDCWPGTRRRGMLAVTTAIQVASVIEAHIDADGKIKPIDESEVARLIADKVEERVREMTTKKMSAGRSEKDDDGGSEEGDDANPVPTETEVAKDVTKPE